MATTQNGQFTSNKHPETKKIDMSGNSSGSSNRNNPQGPVENCSTLYITTQLFSPVPTILATLKPKDILKLEYDSPKGPVKVITPKGDLVGTLIPKELVKLIHCLELGYEYRVIVKSIVGGTCLIQIKR